MAKTIKQKAVELEESVQSINIAKAMNECLWVGDEKHKTIYVNPAFEKISEYSLKECIGKDCIFFFDEEGKQIIESHHKLRKKGLASQYEATMVSKFGRRIPLLISGAPTITGGTIGVFTNLTEMKKMQQKAKLIEQTIQNSNDAIITLDEKRKITSWNNGATKLFDYKEKEVLGKNINIIVPAEKIEEAKKITEQVQLKNFVRNIETTRVNKSGNKIEVNISSTKVIDENKNFIGYLVNYTNISEQKRTVDELQRRFDAIQDAYKELGLQQRQLDYFYDIAVTASNKATTLENLCSLIVSAICMLTKCDAAILRIYNKEARALDLKASLGVNLQWANKGRIPYQNSLARDAAKHGRPLLIDNVQNSIRHKSTKLLKSHAFATLILVPLQMNGKIIGSLSLYAHDPEKFRFIETDFLDKFGKQCSLALCAKIWHD